MRGGAAEAGYQPFPNIAARNGLQRLLEVPLFVSTLRLPRSMRVLEVGCGRGIALAALDRHCAPSRLVGLDIDRALLTEARESLEADCVSAELIASDLRCMPFPDAAFDLVIDFGTCYHVSRREEALREIHRVLAPGGIFATETPLAQALAHPIRTQGKALPWHAVPDMTLRHDAVLWASWKKG